MFLPHARCLRPGILLFFSLIFWTSLEFFSVKILSIHNFFSRPTAISDLARIEALSVKWKRNCKKASLKPFEIQLFTVRVVFTIHV